MTTETTTDHSLVQAELVARYQQSLARAGGDRIAVDDDGQDALAALVDDITPLLYKIIYDKASERFGGHLPEGVVADCYAEMVAAVIECAGRFDPDRCPVFHSWVTGKQGEARAALTRTLAYATGQDGLDARAQRALSVAASAEKAFVGEHGRKPTVPELQAAMLDYSYQYQYERLTCEEQQLPEEQWRKIARDKLSNSAMLKSISNIDQLRHAASRAVSPDGLPNGWDLVEGDEPVHGADDSVMADAEHAEMGQLLAVAVGGLAARDRQIVMARLSGRDGADSTLAAVADRYRVTVAEVKSLVTDAKARLHAPHAQFGFLAPGLGGQFEEAASAPATGVAALLGRLGSALV